MLIDLDLRLDFTKMLKQELERLGDAPGAELDFHKLYLRWSNYQARQLLVQPWQLEISKELQGRELSNEVEAGLDHLLHKARQGKDLKPHLSKGIHKLDGFDHLLTDWGIVHLHLGRDILEDGMVSRTTELLYVFPKDNTLYCIDLLGHRDFANIELLEIMKRNWPHLVPKLEGIAPDSSLTAEQIITLRKKGVNYAPSLADGTVVFSPGEGGFVAGGFNVKHVIGADYLEQRLIDAEKSIKSSAVKIRKIIRLRTGKEQKKVKLSIVQITAEDIRLRELYSGVQFSFNC